jgi:CelD/BcsL family acetyltransferase involved in cellulose biosynthesis
LTLDVFGTAAFWAPLDRGVCDYNGSMTAPDFRPTPLEMRGIWTRIVAVLPDDASFLYLDKMPVALGARVEPLACLSELRRSHVVRHPLRLDGDFATLRDTRFCQTTVRSLARKRKKLARKGRLTFEVATGADASEAFERLMVWRAERFGDRPTTTDFYRRLVAAGDPARVAWLALDGVPISACFGLAEPEAFRLLAVAHDDAYKNWSPGLLVIESAIAWAVERGFGEFDFTIGSEAYKFAFGVTPEPLWLLADEFDPNGSAMLRLLLTRNLLSSKLKRWIDPRGPRRRDGRAEDQAKIAG